MQTDGYQKQPKAAIGTGDLPSEATLDSELAAHTTRTDNPHSVTYGQVGAASAAQGALADTASQPGHTHDEADVTVDDTGLTNITATNLAEALAVIDSLLGGGSTVDIQEFTSGGTWTKPSSATVCLFIACGGGGGGGGGSRHSTGLAGAAGGGGGSVGIALCKASDLASTATVTIGAGGAGGAARTTGTDVGPTNGSNGGDTYATSGGNRIVTGKGGGGTQTDFNGPYYSYPKNPLSDLDALVVGRDYNGAGNLTGVSRHDYTASDTFYDWSHALLGGRGGYVNPVTGDTLFGRLSLYAAGGGGPGGSAWNASDDRKGGPGGVGAYALNPAATAPAGGGVNVAGTSATAPTLPWMPGSGGGGGGSNHGGAGKNGGNGVRGGGGGGGGAAANGNNSGAGGSGGNGFMVVISW